MKELVNRRVDRLVFNQVAESVLMTTCGSG